MVQVLAFPLFKVKPSPEPMLTYCQIRLIDPLEYISVKFESKYEYLFQENLTENAV